MLARFGVSVDDIDADVLHTEVDECKKLFEKMEGTEGQQGNAIH